jgi:hypothetical protein
MTVTIFEARKLKVADDAIRGTLVEESADPYCILNWNGKEVGRTLVQEKTLRPMWHADFRIDTSEKPQADKPKEEQCLRIDVFDHDPDGNGKHDFMGQILLADYDVNADADGQWRPLRRRNMGSDKKTRRYNKFVGGELRYQVVRTVVIHDDNDESHKASEQLKQALLESGGGEDHWKKIEEEAIAASLGTMNACDDGSESWAAASCTDCGGTEGLTESAEWAGYYYCEACTKRYSDIATDIATEVAEPAVEMETVEEKAAREAAEQAEDQARLEAEERARKAAEIPFSDTDSDGDGWKSVSGLSSKFGFSNL